MYYEEPYQEPTPSNCCCGTRGACCPQGSLISIICGGGQVCGILMLLSALIAVLVLSICMTGTFYARRRRQQLLAMHAAGDGAPNGAIGGVGGGGPFRPAEQITIDEADIAGLRVKFGSGCCTPVINEALGGGIEPTIEDGSMNINSATISTAATPESETSETKECPICLDAVAVHSDTWAIFPCSHGCCRPCFSDLLRHNSRRVNNRAVWAVMCPLCRKTAIAPEGEMPSAASAPIAVVDPPIATVVVVENSEQQTSMPQQRQHNKYNLNDKNKPGSPQIELNLYYFVLYFLLQCSR
jgi:Ring finger domain